MDHHGQQQVHHLTHVHEVKGAARERGHGALVPGQAAERPLPGATPLVVTASEHGVLLLYREVVQEAQQLAQAVPSPLVPVHALARLQLT